MSDENPVILAAAYPDDENARAILGGLESMHHAATITLHDAAIVTKNEEGTIHIEETDELTGGEGAARGAVIGGIFGLIFPPSMIVTSAVGGAIGGLIGKLKDTGIKTDSLEGFATKIKPGEAALVVLVSPDSVVATQNALTGYDGELISDSIPDEVMKQLFIANSSNLTS